MLFKIVLTVLALYQIQIGRGRMSDIKKKIHERMQVHS